VDDHFLQKYIEREEEVSVRPHEEEMREAHVARQPAMCDMPIPPRGPFHSFFTRGMCRDLKPTIYMTLGEIAKEWRKNTK
jgi:hypothetical protein